MSWRVATLLLIGCLSSCVHVQPWERETLAQPAMQEQLDPDAESFDAHVAGAREAALDPGAAGGGGCGCN